MYLYIDVRTRSALCLSLCRRAEQERNDQFNVHRKMATSAQHKQRILSIRSLLLSICEIFD